MCVLGVGNSMRSKLLHDYNVLNKIQVENYIAGKSHWFLYIST